MSSAKGRLFCLGLRAMCYEKTPLSQPPAFNKIKYIYLYGLLNLYQVVKHSLNGELEAVQAQYVLQNGKFEVLKRNCHLDDFLEFTKSVH